MKLRKILLGIGLLIGVWFAFFADRTPENDIVDAATPAKTVKQEAKKSGNEVLPGKPAYSQVVNQSGVKAEKKPGPDIGSIIDRKSLISGDYKASDSFFSAQSWVPPPPPVAKAPPPPPPSAPPMPFRYIGKRVEEGVTEVYLSYGEKTYIVQEQSVLEGSYRVDVIKPPVMTLTYLPLNQVQTIQIGNVD
ncbi:hypothetical protein H8L32_00725 [Undibacterium sp. CY18W]|uniref:Prolin-rich transmembrane protein n=1 Tax=Undibacterium hunanense TaxID=2762292 RepID=A0ABR6ZJC2_9BURK|nr:hypothetical protein [Undibacterium hunanense]MBC3915994.1 hypothetical protein [Undibacterium hunanense]